MFVFQRVLVLVSDMFISLANKQVYGVQMFTKLARNKSFLLV